MLAIDEAIDRVREETGRDEIHIGGYSQGGMFCYQVAAYRRSEGIDSIVVFGSPVDTRGTLSFGLPEDAAIGAAAFLAEHVFATSGVPAWMSRTGFRLLDPAKSLRQRLAFVRQLHDRESLLPKERQRRFLEADGWVAWPGPALADVIRQFGVHNRLVSGGFVIEDRLVTLADMTCPILAFVGENDEIAPARSVRAARWAAPRSDVYEVSLPAGHFGLVVGSTAVETTWPTVAAWMQWRDGRRRAARGGRADRGDAGARPRAGSAPRTGSAPAPSSRSAPGSAPCRRSPGPRSAPAGRFARSSATRAGQLDQLNRLGRVNPRTRISFGLLLDEQAEEAPDDVVLLFEDRAHTHQAVKERVDNVVRGLLEIGVRQGEHVGVLMQTRPSALTVVAALNRVGAVAVLMRPDGDPSREAELGRAARIIADPQNGEAAAAATNRQVYVLGGGGKARKLAAGPDRHGADRARRGPGAGLVRAQPRARRRSRLHPLHRQRRADAREPDHQRALGALGVRHRLLGLALARRHRLQRQPRLPPLGAADERRRRGRRRLPARRRLATSIPSTFWDEVRRYGATVVSYTWAMMDEIAEAPPNPGEEHHPVRLFMGSGMPRGLWRRVTERFAPARVLEFYASTEGDAVLVNVTGRKAGSKGQPLPGQRRGAGSPPTTRWRGG